MKKFGQAKFHITSYKYVMTFGKFKGKTVREILETSPSYLLWLYEKDIVSIKASIHNKAVELYRKNLEAETKAYEHLGHNYSSYYEDYETEIY